MKNLILLFVSCLMFVACGSNTSSEKFTYNYEVNDCPTGEQTFSSLKEMCVGLTDDFLNNFCATSLRCERFAQDCQEFDDIDVSCPMYGIKVDRE